VLWLISQLNFSIHCTAFMGTGGRRVIAWAFWVLASLEEVVNRKAG